MDLDANKTCRQRYMASLVFQSRKYPCRPVMNRTERDSGAFSAFGVELLEFTP